MTIEIEVADAGVVAASLLLNHPILWHSCLRTAGPKGRVPVPALVVLDDSGVDGEAIKAPAALHVPIE